jgi:hypothetical protein
MQATVGPPPRRGELAHLYEAEALVTVVVGAIA